MDFEAASSAESKGTADAPSQAAAQTTVGTIIYAAPEVLSCGSRGCAGASKSEAYGRRADVWSLGASVVEMLSGAAPFPSAAVAVYRVSVQREHPAMPELLSDEGLDFLEQCFRFGADERPTAEALRDHAFCRDIPKEGVDDPILFTATHANAAEAFDLAEEDTPRVRAPGEAWGEPDSAGQLPTRTPPETLSEDFGESFLNSTV